jgi:hypothetical protein
MSEKSKGQERLMAQAYSYRTGKLKPSEMSPSNKEEILKLAKSMSVKALEKFSSIKKEGIHNEIEENESINESALKMSAKDMYKHPGFDGVKFGTEGKINPFYDFDSKKGSKNQYSGNLMDYRDWIKTSKKSD